MLEQDILVNISLYDQIYATKGGVPDRIGRIGIFLKLDSGPDFNTSPLHTFLDKGCINSVQLNVIVIK